MPGPYAVGAVGYEGFVPDSWDCEQLDVEVDGVRLHARVAGQGPPVLLLHGYPETSAMWHRVAPALAEDHTVVAADLRGYGRSDRPASDAGHAAYAKRAMAADQAGLMRALGHPSYAVVGHDRGARVAHRLALDHAEAVTSLAVLDIAPTRHVFGDVDRQLALSYDHWFFLAQENDLPEVLIGGAAEHWLRTKLRQWAGPDASFDEAVVAEYVACFDAASIHATTEDYRAGATADLEDDEASWVAGDRVRCPTLALWGEAGLVGRRYDVLEVWRSYVDAEVTGHAVPGGHFVPEEAPHETVAALREHLGHPGAR
ncbi:alpha/beta hydrolase [Nocardioides anomalus]|uniref:Alpha/beta hydrolase n=1 Tax=Nocardioides anomalus TaxID=2712223 RepID=A0A6G6WGI9_9ACTN|nr:alpha/beta hydrolase [Nocardioides anomalus]QIG44205.1 alpha/beta hydrolase [Nocardioides anomalus]